MHGTAIVWVGPTECAVQLEKWGEAINLSGFGRLVIERLSIGMTSLARCALPTEGAADRLRAFRSATVLRK